MFEQSVLTERFHKLLAESEQAQQLYASMADNLNDPDLRRQLQQLCRDKQRHARLAERLLEIVQ